MIESVDKKVKMVVTMFNIFKKVEENMSIFKNIDDIKKTLIALAWIKYAMLEMIN